jgi:hypothetical protein
VGEQAGSFPLLVASRRLLARKVRRPALQAMQAVATFGGLKRGPGSTGNPCKGFLLRDTFYESPFRTERFHRRVCLMNLERLTSLLGGGSDGEHRYPC